MPEPRPKKPGKPSSDPLSRLRTICLAFVEVTEVVKHTRPCFAVRGKTFVMFMDNHHGDGRLAIWCKATRDAQSMFVESDPDRFFVPPYVGPRGWIGVRLEGRVDWPAVTSILEEGHRLAAPKRITAPKAGPAPRRG